MTDLPFGFSDDQDEGQRLYSGYIGSTPGALRPIPSSHPGRHGDDLKLASMFGRQRRTCPKSRPASAAWVNAAVMIMTVAA
jgi:hypothetical protein